MVHKHKVTSSAVECVWHDQDRGELVVAFKRGTGANNLVYVYEGVPDSKVAELLRADSIGRFVATEIRNRFNHRTADRADYDAIEDADSLQGHDTTARQAWKRFISGDRPDGVRVIRIRRRARAAA